MISRRETHACSYLPNLTARTHYRYLENCEVTSYQKMLERGWRRFGNVFFRPECSSCQECRSLRVEVDKFAPNRSMQRTLSKNSDVNIAWTRPTVSPRHLALFARYHQFQNRLRGWPIRDTEPSEYFYSFVSGAGAFGHELRVELGGALIAVALVDLLPQALSAVYCYYDPQLRQRALGVLAVLLQIERAREAGIPFLYLGYWVEPNVSMRYKSHYQPHQLLWGRPSDTSTPSWLTPAELPTSTSEVTHE